MPEEKKVTIDLQEQFIHSGRWFGPGKVTVEKSIADDLVASQERIAKDRRESSPNASPRLIVTQPDKSIAPQQGTDGVLTVKDFEKQAQESGKQVEAQAQAAAATKKAQMDAAQGKGQANDQPAQ